MSETRTFDVGVIMSVTGEALMCDIGDLYGILGWLTGEDLMTHQLPRASRESRGFLSELFPDVARVQIPEWTTLPGWEEMSNDEKREKISSWLNYLGTKIGPTREVPRLPEGDHTVIDPIAELRMMRPDMPIITIEVGPQEKGQE